MPQTDWGQTWKEYHKLSDPCRHQKWCRLHWWPDYHAGNIPYPLTHVTFMSSRFGWQNVDVFCGPGSFIPKSR